MGGNSETGWAPREGAGPRKEGGEIKWGLLVVCY